MGHSEGGGNGGGGMGTRAGAGNKGGVWDPMTNLIGQHDKPSSLTIL